ncbi:hypothetical protein K8S19_06545 [bacterium]|nr:hypothetical protein [bacterium]
MNKLSVDVNAAEEQAALAFMRDDFNQCFEQMRYYDNQIVGIFKFLFVVYTFLTGVVTALYQYFLGTAPTMKTPAVVTLGVGLLLGMFLYAILIRNRIYFVKAARYINMQRVFFMKIKPLGFENAVPMYDQPDRPRHFNWISSQSWMIYMVAFLNAMVFYMISLFSRSFSSLAGAAIAFSVFCIQIAAAVIVLKLRD